MKNRVRTGRHSGAAFMRAIAVFALVPAAGSPALAGVPDSAGAATLAAQLKGAHYARIGIDGRTYVLVKPKGSPEGLMYERVRGFPQERPALITGSRWDTLAAPPNPVPWSRLERIEAGIRSGHGGTGAVVGLIGGLALGGYVAAFAEMGGENAGWQYMIGTAALTTVIGAGIGALIRTTDWVQVHPESRKAAR